MIIAMGGAFEFFNIHYGCGGTLQRWAIPTWKQTATFCRERQLCFKSAIRPELGVLFPHTVNQPQTDNLYGGAPGLDALTSWLNALQDAQYSTKVILQHQLLEPRRLTQFKAIVIPDASTLSPQAIQHLLNFTQQGGKLLLDLPALNAFRDHIGARVGDIRQQLVFIDGHGALATGEVTATLNLTPSTARPGGAGLYTDNLYHPALRHHASTIQPHGHGAIAALAFNFAQFYQDNRTPAIRTFLRHLWQDELDFHPEVTVSGSHFAELTVADAPDGSLLVNLINLAGEHQLLNARTYDEIPPIGPLTITFSPQLNITSVRQFPENLPLPLTPAPDGRLAVTLPRLDIHTVLQARRN